MDQKPRIYKINSSQGFVLLGNGLTSGHGTNRFILYCYSGCKTYKIGLHFIIFKILNTAKSNGFNLINNEEKQRRLSLSLP